MIYLDFPDSGVGGGGSFDISITANADDGRDANGAWNGGGATVGCGNSGGVILDGGFRLELTIPAASTIVAATLELNVVTVNIGALTNLYGQRVNDAAAWNGVGPATMSITTAVISRTLNSIQLETFDVAAILQEIIDNHSGIGGHVAFGLLDNSSAKDNNIGVEALEHAGIIPARLFGSYT